MIFKLKTLGRFIPTTKNKIVIWVGNEIPFYDNKFFLFFFNIMKPIDVCTDMIDDSYTPSNISKSPTIEDFLKGYNGSMENIVIVLSSPEYMERLYELEKEYDLSNTEVHFLVYLRLAAEKYSLPEIQPGAVQKIPKKIHYCWFGGKELHPLANYVIESWYEHHPDWEIIRWDETNYDPFIREGSTWYEKEIYTAIKRLYDDKMYVFLSDIARFDIIYKHGGIYMDIDMLCVKPLDRFLYDESFITRHEFMSHNISIFGSIPKNRALLLTPQCLEELSEYDVKNLKEKHGEYIYNKGGFFNVYKNILVKKFDNIDVLKLDNGMNLYATDVFIVIDGSHLFENITENTHAIHYALGSYASISFRELSNRIPYNIKYRPLIEKLYGEDFYKTPYIFFEKNIEME